MTTPQPAGSQGSMLVTGLPTLADGEIYRFAIRKPSEAPGACLCKHCRQVGAFRAEDDVGNISDLDTEKPGVV